MIQRPGDNPAERTRFLESVIRRLKGLTGDVKDLKDFDALFSQAWTDWTPAYITYDSMVLASPSTDLAQYIKIGKFVFVRMRFSITISGTPSTRMGVSTPIDPNIGVFGLETTMQCQIINTGSRAGIATTQGFVTPRRFDIRRFDHAALTAGSFTCSLSGYYLT